MTTTESEWDRRAVDEHIAGLVVEDRVCSGCSNDLGLSTDPDMAAQGVDVSDDVICFVCQAKAEHKRVLDKQHEKQPEWWDGRSLVAALVSTDKPTEGG